MGVVKLSTAGILDYSKTSNFLSGNSAASYSTGFDLLETTNISTDTASVTLSGLSAYSDYKHLQIRAVVKGNANNFGNSYIALTFNGVTSGYSRHRLEADGSSVSASGTGSAPGIYLNDATAESNSSYAGVFGASITDILDFSNPYKNTTVRSLTGSIMQNKSINLNSGSYPALTAVTSLTLTKGNGDFVSGSRFSLYGSK